MPLASRARARRRKIAKEVRQLNRKLPEPGILLEQHTKVAGFLLPGLIAPKAIRFVEQRRQNREKLVAALRRPFALKDVVLKQWHDVARGTTTSIEAD